jgi:hypothetical protein
MMGPMGGHWWSDWARHLPSGCRHDWRRVAWSTLGIATIPIFATINPTPGADIGIEIEIMATGTSIEAHITAPALETALSWQYYACSEESRPIRHIKGQFEAR